MPVFRHAEEADKATKEMVGYSMYGTRAENCGVCRYFRAPTSLLATAADAGSCDRIQGSISEGGWCKFFKVRATYAKHRRW